MGLLPIEPECSMKKDIEEETYFYLVKSLMIGTSLM